MFSSVKGTAFFLISLGLTVGLLLAPRLIPGGWGYGMARQWTLGQTGAAFATGLAILGAVLFLGGRLVRHAQSWKEPRVITAAVLIALVGNTLYMVLMDGFALQAGWRGLVAALGVPVIYGNLGRVLGRQSLARAMASLFTGALTTLGAGFIIAALIRHW